MKTCLAVFIITSIVFLSFSSLLAKDLSFVPDFTLEDIQGDKITLNSFKNKQPVLLFFWTTWCPFCRSELKLLNDIDAVLLKHDMKILTVNVGESQGQIERFFRNRDGVYPVLLDKDTKVSRSFNVLGVPTYVIINKCGKVVYKGNYFPYEEYEDLLRQ
jgi:peroxiredoxin